MPGTNTHRSPNQPVASQQEHVGGCLLRLCWMFFGNVALVVSAVFISSHKASFLSVADLVFWGIVVLLAGIRYWDIAHCHGFTASDQPATMATWRRYVAFLGAFSVAIWAVAHAVAYFGR